MDVYMFIINSLHELENALNTLDFKVFEKSSTLDYSTFVAVFLGGTVVFTALHWKWKKG